MQGKRTEKRQKLQESLSAGPNGIVLAGQLADVHSRCITNTGMNSANPLPAASE